MRHRRDTQVRGRHRAAGLPRHRAPRTPLVTDRGRSTAMAAALIAGVGVAGISAAAAGGSPQGTVDTADAAMNALAAAPGATPLPSVEIVAATPAATPGPSTTARDRFTAALAAAKVRTTPSPVPPPVWVHPMPEAAVTSCFGPRWGRLHAGVDLAAPSGTPIRAAGAGTVVQAGAWADGYGISVLIDHGNGYLTHYAHMSATVIQPGEQVQAGQEIGLEGSTGHSTGPHLHFEVHQGVWKNTVEPTAWLHAHGVNIAGCAALP